MAKMQGFPFYDKPMRIAFSKSKSDVVAKRDGSFVAREKRKRDETEQPKLKAPPPPTPMDTEATTTTAAVRLGDCACAAASCSCALARAWRKQSSAYSALTTPLGAWDPWQDVNMTPSSIIFAQNLPDDCNEMMLEMLFKTYAGFKEVRMVPGSAGLAFIEFTDELTAGTALAGRQNFKLTPTQNLALSYAKK